MSGHNAAEYALLNMKCEIQVKTMCEETWDAITHEITYKHKKTVDPSLQQHKKQLSKVLSAIDEQGEIIKTQIEKKDIEERERKQAAATVYLLHCRDLLQDLNKKYELKLSFNTLTQLKRANVTPILSAVMKHYQKNKTSKALCFLTAMLAVCHKDPKIEDLALLFAKEYAENNPDSPRAEEARASIFWAFNLFDKAIIHGEKALNKAVEKGTKTSDYKNQLCYWVAEATLSPEYAKSALNNQQKNTLKYAKELEKDYSNYSPYIDTAGFLQIALGKTIEDVKKGLELVLRARLVGSKDKNPVIRDLTKIFTLHHEGIAYRIMAEKVRRKRIRVHLGVTK